MVVRKANAVLSSSRSARVGQQRKQNSATGWRARPSADRPSVAFSQWRGVIFAHPRRMSREFQRDGWRAGGSHEGDAGEDDRGAAHYAACRLLAAQEPADYYGDYRVDIGMC